MGLGRMNLREERDAGNVVTKRYYPQGEQRITLNLFYTRDHLGSVREMTDSTGAIRARYDYDAWGRRTKISGDLDADFAYTGHYWDAFAGVYLTYYRPYDPELDRWLNRDPIGERGGINLYGYVFNDPINLCPRGSDSRTPIVGDKVDLHVVLKRER